FVLSLVAFGITYAAYSLGFHQWAPAATLEDGSRATLQVDTVEACFHARTVAQFGDRQAEARWASCRAWLERFGALRAFDLRCYGIAGSMGLGICALFACALSVRFGAAQHKFMRG